MKHKILTILILLLSMEAFAAVRLPGMIGDGMVIQRNQPICIWGLADKYERFTINWMDKQYPVAADENGRWKVILPAEKEGGPYTMNIGGVAVRDILIGDVYLCSGQSNMELPVRRVTDMFAEEIAGYENDQIRHIIVPKEFDFCVEREDTPAAKWKSCTQKNVMEFSALAYFFAKEMYEKTGVPVGLVNASWGGTPVEAWMSEETLEGYPHHISEKRLYEDDDYRRMIKELEGMAFHRWNTELYASDPGYKGEHTWFDPEYDDSHWNEVDMFSQDWGKDGSGYTTGGSHWLRKDFKVGKSVAGKAAVLRLGCIVDSDSVYVNGHFVGTTGYQYPPRIYNIPEGILHEGVNNVTVRIISNGGQPSFVEDKPYKIICGKKEINLEGDWKYHLGAPMPAAPSMMFFCYKPVCLYNAMIHPLQNMKFTGVLWYQGESNVDRRNEYADLLARMMENWRTLFDDADLPFYIVELADFLHKDDIRGREAWAQMRVQQANAVKATENSVLIKNSDLGEWNDIHPLDKKTLGERIAKEALKYLKKKN